MHIPTPPDYLPSQMQRHNQVSDAKDHRIQQYAGNPTKDRWVLVALGDVGHWVPFGVVEWMIHKVQGQLTALARREIVACIEARGIPVVVMTGDTISVADALPPEGEALGQA
jgi:hypothetical protein